MPENELMQATLELGASQETFAALAVHLGIETENLEAEPSLQRLLTDISIEPLGEHRVDGDGAPRALSLYVARRTQDSSAGSGNARHPRTTPPCAP